jgi:Leucine-rich repeat (LRR) protein
MKKLLLLLFICAYTVATAQIVNIPDNVFKTQLLTGTDMDFKDLNGMQVATVDTNRDGEIQSSEALAIGQMIIGIDYYDDSVESLAGIEAFANLTVLRINTHSSLTTIDIAALSNLQEVICFRNANLTSLNVEGLSNLIKLEVDVAALTELDMTGLTSLQELKINDCNISVIDATRLTALVKLNAVSGNVQSINLSGLTALKEFDVSDNSALSTLTLSGNISLEHIRFTYSAVTEINLSGLTALKAFDCTGSIITTPLDFSDCPNIEVVWASGNGIPSIDIENKANLTNITIDNNQLTELNVGYAPALREIKIDYNNITSLDLSKCPLLKFLYVAYNPLTYLNLKNGNTSLLSFSGGSVQDFTQPVFICVDEGEEQFIFSNYNTTWFYPELVNINSYCSFMPGGTFNTIKGTLTYDSNNNGCDVNDVELPYVAIQINDGTTLGTCHTSNGNYTFFTQGGTFTLTPRFENDWFTAAPATVTFVEANNSNVIQNLCVTANGVHRDVEVAIVPIGVARPGFDSMYKIVCKNKGNQTLSGDITFTYNDDVLDYVSASSTPSSTATGSLTWSYSDLLPFETRDITAILNVNGPMETPAVNIGDVLTFSVAVTPVTGDESAADNSFNYKQDVVGSFDPNDIKCLEGATVSPDKIGEYLHYNINFENTGTAPATFIVVKDIIDAAKFDVNTLQILDASYAMETRVTGNKVEFIFDGINLGAAEKGNVTFKIKTLNTLAVNSEVTQQADIFFDYNWPIQTNEATTTFAILISGGLTLDSSIKVYPNPADGIVTISAKAEIKSVQLYDVQGRLLQSGSGDILDVSNRTSGIYFVKIITDKGMNVERLVKK